MSAAATGAAPPGRGPALGAWAARHRSALLVLGAVLLAYAPSLGGEWVWDDVYQYAENPAIGDPWTLVTHDGWAPTGHKDPDDAPIYRPLELLSHVPGQLARPGAAIERAVSLGLHLVVVVLVALLGRALGASETAAWIAAALFGLHPGATEAVAWISARADLLGGALTLGGALAIWRGRDVRGGFLLALAPFCKEPFLFVTASALIWAVGLRRLPWRALVIAFAGALTYVGLRAMLGISLPADGPLDGAGTALSAIGAVAERAARLAFVPTAPDALAPYLGRPWIGAAAVAAGLAGLALARRRPWLALMLGGLPLLAPAAPASLGNGVVADRYFYAAFALSAAALGPVIAPLLERRRAWLAAAAIPLALAPFTVARALDWTSNARLFRAALARHPDHSEAQFLVAHDYHVRLGDCASAIPLYAAAMHASPRAANNLLACWLATGDVQKAAAHGPAIADRASRSPNPAANTARALLLAGDAKGAERWAREALGRAEPTAGRWALLGNALGMQGRHDEALAAFDHALALDPTSEAARRGVAVARGLGADAAARAPGAPPRTPATGATPPTDS